MQGGPMAAPFQYTDPDTGLYFEWEGGEYIDVSVSESAEYATEVINVRDYSPGADTDAVEIDKTQEAFEAECRRWIAEGME